MASYKLEAHLFKPVAAYARRKTFQFQDREVPFYEYRIDLFGFSQSLELTVAIELKLRNWKRAIQQAILYQLCADLVYIALPEVSAGRVDMNALREHGIGLIAVAESGHCRELLPSERSTVMLPNYRDVYVNMLRKGA